MINAKLLLHTIPFPQQGIKEVDTFVAITVLEEKEVPNIWGKGTGIGYRALGEDNRYYICNWERFPDDSSSPTWMWTLEFDTTDKALLSEKVNNGDAMWYDVTQGLPYIDFVPIWLDKYKEIIGYCPIHQRLFTLSLDAECFYCAHCPKAGLPPEPKEDVWKGWK